MTLFWLSHEIKETDTIAKMKYLSIFCIIALVLLPLVISHDSFALQVISGDQVSIHEPVNDEVMIFGETVSIDAPVKGAIVFANNIYVNASVQGDLLAAARQITVNSDVTGKIVAAANDIDLHGKATNVISAANNIHFAETSAISNDAYVAGGTIIQEGNVLGQLKAMTDNFVNNGTAVDLQVIKQDSNLQDAKSWLDLFNLLLVIGLGILGVILVKLFPYQFDAVRASMKKSIIKDTIVGFLLIILSLVVIALAAITVVGIPVSVFGLMILFIGLMLSSLVVSFAIGKKILKLLGQKSSRGIYNISSFIIGFVILNLLYIVPIPYFGPIVQVIVTSAGFGAIYYEIRKSRSRVSENVTA